ncbi:hypothetical protein MTR67_036776 [Solanum verrucosum]|uniref:RNase H type-1 domain-containing protein n=1 Tax=Solanum verrucosum TaxID=315347 RepID=A0AAF0UD88_SOLVR|nr:hypothetical protein MTR67_036776 [Solanum verrucosum]
MEQLNVQIQHIFREANQLADYIANTAINQEGIQLFHSFSQLTSMGRKILNMDKSGVPTIRIKTRKILTRNAKNGE